MEISKFNHSPTRKLFKEILKKWPAVEFMTSDQLGNLISKDLQ